MNGGLYYLENLLDKIIGALIKDGKNLTSFFTYIVDQLNLIEHQKAYLLKEMINMINKGYYKEEDFILKGFFTKETLEEFKKVSAQKEEIPYLTDKLQKYLTKISILKELEKISFNFKKEILNFEKSNIDMSKISQLLLKTTDDNFLSIEEIIEEVKKQKRHIKFFNTEYHKINEMMNNKVFRTGDLHIIGARPGVGKTMFLLNTAIHIAKQGERVAFFTLEMQAENCLRRIVSNLTSLPLKDFWDYNYFKTVLEENKDILTQIPIKFFESYLIDYKDIVSKIRLIHASGHDVIFIDQLSMIKHDDRLPRNYAVENTLRILKSLCLELNIAIIVAVQLNRTAETNETPGLANLKESGALEEASQLVIILNNRNNKDDEEVSSINKDIFLKVSIQKSTHGKKGSIILKADYARCKFIEV